MPVAPERCQSVLRRTERDLLQFASGLQPEHVHSFRTTTRRLQTLFEHVLHSSDRNQRKLLKMLDRIRKRAGKVRDIDVQLSALRSLKAPQEPRRKTQLMQGLLELRAKHEKKLRKVLTKADLRELRKRLKRASRNLKIDASIDPLQVARQMLAQVPLPTGTLTEEVLHRYRIVVKRARYAAEFAPRSAESAQIIAALKRLQDAIGHWHDWLTLTNTAASRLGDLHQSTLVAALHNVTGGKFRLAVAALSEAPDITKTPVAVRSVRKLGTKTPAAERADSAA